MSSLKQLALKAKSRLKAISQDNEQNIEIENIKTYEEACLSARLQYAIIANQKRIEDDPLYPKVKKLLSKDIDIQNPLSLLIEHDIYDNLDQSRKEKYMYKLSKRYRAIKEKVLKELEIEPLNN